MFSAAAMMFRRFSRCCIFTMLLPHASFALRRFIDMPFLLSPFFFCRRHFADAFMPLLPDDAMPPPLDAARRRF